MRFEVSCKCDLVISFVFSLWLLLSSFATSSASGMVYRIRELFQANIVHEVNALHIEVILQL